MTEFSPTMSDAMRMLRPPRAQRYVKLLLFSLVYWAGVVAVESSQVLAGDMAHGIVLPPVHYLAWASFNWFVLALLTPLIYELGKRYPVTGTNWARHLIAPHALVCLACMIAQAVGRGIVGALYTLHHEMEASPIELTVEWVVKRGMLVFIAYWVIVVAAGLAQMREQMRLRELRQAQLETRLASAELETLRMQIQPHFLFNTLQAAITLIHDDPAGAEDVLLRLSELLRISFDRMEANEIPLGRELEFLDLYVGIQKRRFGDRLEVEIHADAALLERLVPPLILQPLVENAIHHGIGKHKGSDCVEVFVSDQNGGLQVEVWNANSVVTEASEKLMESGVGLRNTRARLEHLYGPGASLVFRALAKGGAAAIISIPPRGQAQGNAATAGPAR